MPVTRRSALLGTLAALAAAGANAADDPLDAIERRAGGRLGVAVLDTGNGRHLEHRAQERFAMCSTFKFLLAAAVLVRVDRGKEKLDRVVPYSAADLVGFSRDTKQHVVEGGMTVSALCQAAVKHSDNTAANLLLASLGGPPGWTKFARSIGDRVSRLDRIEPELNSATPGDPRDTTTPAAMLTDMRNVLLSDTLSDASRWLLGNWMTGNALGAHRLRAGLPAEWVVGDKTGSGSHNACNDIAILWPPKRRPILACVYFAESDATGDACEAAIADVGRVIAAMP